MKRVLVIAVAAAVSVPTLSVPSFAAAQSSYESCRDYQRRKANQGTLAGGVIGALVGSGVASRGVKTEGAVLGGAVGAVAGHQIAKGNVKCGSAPRAHRSSTRRSAAPSRSYRAGNCRWVQEYYAGRNHSFEVCRGPDGVWRPSGRS